MHLSGVPYKYVMASWFKSLAHVDVCTGVLINTCLSLGLFWRAWSEKPSLWSETGLLLVLGHVICVGVSGIDHVTCIGAGVHYSGAGAGHPCLAGCGGHGGLGHPRQAQCGYLSSPVL